MDITINLANGTEFEYENNPPETLFSMANFFQALHAIIRAELGVYYPNNFLLNTTVAESAAVIQPLRDYPLNDDIYNNIRKSLSRSNSSAGGDPTGYYLPWSPSASPIQIQTTYLCHVWRAKSAGPAFISVLVATLAIFTSGWGVAMLVASFIAKKQIANGGHPSPFCISLPDGCDVNLSGNVCHAHDNETNKAITPMFDHGTPGEAPEFSWVDLF